MAKFNYGQAIVPFSLSLLRDPENPGEYSDMTPMAVMLAFWRIRKWLCDFSVFAEISGSDGFHNSGSASFSNLLLHGAGWWVKAATPSDIWTPLRNEHDLLMLLWDGYPDLPAPRIGPGQLLSPLGIGHRGFGAGNPNLYGDFDGTLDWTFEDGTTRSQVLSFGMDALTDYYWSNYTPRRKKLWSNQELRVRSFVNAYLPDESYMGVGNNQGDVGFGNSAFQSVTYPFPLVWTDGAPGSHLQASVAQTQNLDFDPLGDGSSTYTMSVSINFSMRAYEYWPYANPDGSNPAIDSATGAVIGA